MDKNCQELLENIQRTLHECKDNRKTINIYDTLDINKCNNVKLWAKNIKDSVPLKVNIKNPIFINKYSIDYKVSERSLIISEE
jgi:hypothetical protein